MEKIHGIAKVINKIYQRGYMPSRSMERYRPITTLMVNCFGHACFNLEENDLLNTFQSYDMRRDLHVFFRRFKIGRHYVENAKDMTQCFQEKIRATGLKVDESSLDENLKDNQWKVAFYFRDEYKDEEGNEVSSDPHFMLQTKSGLWTSKMGTIADFVEVFKEPPEKWKDYTLRGIYKITNPYLEKEVDEENE